MSNDFHDKSISYRILIGCIRRTTLMGRCPFLSCTVRLAPFSVKHCTIFKRPQIEAYWSAVNPFCSCQDRLDPWKNWKTMMVLHIEISSILYQISNKTQVEHLWSMMKCCLLILRIAIVAISWIVITINLAISSPLHYLSQRDSFPPLPCILLFSTFHSLNLSEVPSFRPKYSTID